MMDKIFSVIRKNFKLLLRSPSSAAIIIIGPLILILLVGLAFSNTQPYGVKIATYAPQYNDLVKSILGKLNEKQFEITKMKNEDACILRVKKGQAHICIVFPENFEISNDKTNNITFHVDYSKINLVWNVLDVISSKISARNTEITKDLAGTMVKTLETTQSEINQKIPVLVKLSTRNTELVNLGEDIQRTVSGISVKLDTSDLDLDVLENRLQLLYDDADKGIKRGLRLVQDIKDSESDLNLTVAQQTALTNLLESTSNDLETSRNDLAGVYTPGKSSLLEDYLTNLKLKLGKVTQQLNDAEQGKNVAGNDLKTMKGILSDSMEEINDLQATLDLISKNIQGITVTDSEKIANPVTTTIMPVTVDSHFNYLFPTLIVLIIMITSVLLSSTLVIVEKRSRAFFRNCITPTSDVVFTLGIFLSALAIILVQLIIFLLIAGIAFKTNIFTTLPTTFVTLLFITAFFILTGMFVGYIFRSEETTTIAAITVCSIFMFFSSTILPLESMPLLLQKFAEFNPYVLSESALRQSVFFEFGFNQLIDVLLWLVAYSVFMFVIVLMLQRYMKVITLHKIHKEKKIKQYVTGEKVYPSGFKGVIARIEDKEEALKKDWKSRKEDKKKKGEETELAKLEGKATKVRVIGEERKEGKQKSTSIVGFFSKIMQKKENVQEEQKKEKDAKEKDAKDEAKESKALEEIDDTEARLKALKKELLGEK